MYHRLSSVCRQALGYWKEVVVMGLIGLIGHLNNAVALADISVTAYTDVLGDVTDALGSELPGIATTGIAIGAGLLVLSVGYRTIRRFVR